MNYHDMKNNVQLNAIIADFRRIDIILLIYKAMYLTNPPPPSISGIFSVLFAFLSSSSRSIIQFLYFPYSQMTKEQLIQPSFDLF